ncbi:SIS domain-containing protein [Herbiconiux daphne]|uniref:Sugar isomerase n=1 Tax=Herbiconiux daphne TaxID=2970914 RepID=A0ABT2GW48_9MICO|nr:sugar isomerase [Herbiconiux daphne]MCS5732185.1 sugar isomerase [Herbiconiux daphne]
MIGCGTSWFIAQSYARLREAGGFGVTDAFAASEHSLRGRDYDTVLVISRSGTTTEILDLVAELGTSTRVMALTADPDAPLAQAVPGAIVLDWADERSIVQTRFATTALMALRASLGEDLRSVIEAGREAALEEIDARARVAGQFTFLGRGWSVGLANEAALKLREAAQVWTESYPAFEYRHGPISIAEPGRVVWSLGTEPSGIADDVEPTGALFIENLSDPVVDLLRIQRLAVLLANDRGLDPDRPRSLTRAVTLTDR